MPQAPSIPDQSTRIIKVVMIEDQRRIREGLEALIGGTEGYTCTGAFRSMEEALARPWTAIPDVVLLDIGLPGMSGIDVYERAQANGWDGAVLFVSGFADPANLARIYGKPFLAKPFGVEALKDQVARILAGTSLHRTI